MNRTALVAGLVLATSIVVAPAALAQDDGPGTGSCREAREVVELKVGIAAQAVIDLERASAAVPAADKALIAKLQDEYAALQVQLDAALDALRTAPTDLNAAEAIRLGDLLNGKAAELVGAGELAGDELAGKTQALIDARASLVAALATQEEACDGPVDPDPSETPDPTPEPEPTDPPTPNTFNCIDFPLNDGRTAQDVLDADASDPHNLDTDSDGVACEVDQPNDGVVDDETPTTTPAPAPEVDVDLSEDVTTPSGGVATGGGPA